MPLPGPSASSNFRFYIKGELKHMEYTKEQLAQILKKKAKKEKEQKDDIIKTAEVPKPLNPMEKAKALLQKTDSKYQSYIAKKLLPSLNK